MWKKGLLCFFTYHVLAFLKEIGFKIEKKKKKKSISLTPFLTRQRHIAVKDESSITCLSGCSAVKMPSSHLQFRHFQLLITVFRPPFLFISLLVSVPFLSTSTCLPSSKPPFLSLLSFRVRVRARRGLLTVKEAPCDCCTGLKGWHYLYSFKPQLIRGCFYYDFKMRHLTFRCHKVQPVWGHGTRTSLCSLHRKRLGENPCKV